MIRFMVLGAPRSGTAWAANWLTTDKTHCFHDPLFRWHYDHLDEIQSPKKLGISCTGMALFPSYLRNHPAQKVILHRPIEDVDASLVRLGLPPLVPGWDKALHDIDGKHISWKDIFDPVLAPAIYEYLLDRPFDLDRHAELIDLNMQMNFGTVHVNRHESIRLFNDMRKIQENLK